MILEIKRIDIVAENSQYNLCPLVPQLLWLLRGCHLMFALIRSEQHFRLLTYHIFIIFDVVDGKDHAFKCQNFRPGTAIHKREKHY